MSNPSWNQVVFGEEPDDDDWRNDPEEDSIDSIAVCGWDGQSGCVLSGTEYCDFRCPDSEAYTRWLNSKATTKDDSTQPDQSASRNP